jgi:uncharacterized protein YndB with AHSA1/START domain
MPKRSVEHATFAIERLYDATPARVFSAWSSAEAKLRWFFCEDSWRVLEHRFDFRAGGRELLSVEPPGGVPHVMDALYHDIIESRRIVYGYDMYIGEARISVSLATVELEPKGRSTRLTFTEQGVYLDGLASPAEREEGTRVGLENLATMLAGSPG